MLIYRAPFTLLLLLTCYCAQAMAQSAWTRTVAPHFVLYCEGSDTLAARSQANQTLSQLERERSFFLRTKFRDLVPKNPVTIVAFEGLATYAAYRTTPGAFAFYRHVREGDYIVLQQLSGGPQRAAVHEYVHSVFYRLAPNMPLWLAEGLAEVYSSTHRREGSLVTGTEILEHVRALDNARPLNLQTIFEVGLSSPSYVDPAQVWRFYAISWATAHMLARDPYYAAQLPAFLASVSAGSSAEAALQRIYGKAINVFEADVAAYIRHGLWVGFPETPDLAQDVAVTSASVAGPEPNSTLADLVRSGSPQQSAIQTALEKAAAETTRDSAPDEALAYLALRNGQTEQALARFKAALDKGCQHADALLRLAELQQVAGVSGAELVPLLNRVVELDPANGEARFRLGWIAAKAGSYRIAIAMLSDLRTATPDQKFGVLYTLAYCCLKNNDAARGRSFSLDARAEAHTPQQQQEVDALLQYAERARATS